MKKLIIIGAGAAGMMAAISAKESHPDWNVDIYDGNEKAGKKLFITGKGRCNLTNASDIEVILKNVVNNPKFLYSAFYTFTNEQVMELFEENGVKLKVERGNRVFPESDRASDIIDCLKRMMKKRNVFVHYNKKIKELLVEDDTIKGVKTQDGETIFCDAVIVATGGNSYQSTGSTGDGYVLAKQTGHRVTNILPALVPVNLKEEMAVRLMGLSLKNVSVEILADIGKKKQRVLYKEQGEMLFTHFGVSGPLFLSASSYIASCLNQYPDAKVTIHLDLKPALTKDMLDKRILRDFSEVMNKNFNHALDKLLPKKLIPEMIDYTGIDPYKKVNEVTAAEREKLVDAIKCLTFTVTGLRGFKEAIVTQGGVDVRDVNASTMESKLIHSLYFAGEVLDVDALTGGYNLQIAWSTGWLAGMMFDH